MDKIEDTIYSALSAHLNCAHLDVSGDGRHFDAVVVSDDFLGKSRVERHKLVYQALGDRMKEEIHALSLKLYTPDEWK